MTQLHSKALLFAFAALATCPAAWAAPDHFIEVSIKNGRVKYDRVKGKNANGYIFIPANQEVQWACKKNDDCQQITINLGNSGLVCTNAGGPSSTPANLVTCDVDYTTIKNTCQKSAVGTLCSLYTTTVYPASGPPITDDPEFIVDDNPLIFLRTDGGIGLLILLGLVLGAFVGFRWGKTQGHSPTPNHLNHACTGEKAWSARSEAPL